MSLSARVNVAICRLLVLVWGTSPSLQGRVENGGLLFLGRHGPFSACATYGIDSSGFMIGEGGSIAPSIVFV